MRKIEVTLDNQTFIVKQSFRALMEFERITGRNAYEVNTSVNDSLTIFYCILKAANRETFAYSFDEFADLLDESPKALEAFNAYVMKLAEDNAEVANKAPETNEKKK